MEKPEIYVNARFLTQEITGVQRFAIEISKELLNQYGRLVFLCPAKGVIHRDLFDRFNAISVGSTSSYYWEQVELPMFLKKKGSPLLLNLTSTSPIFYSNKVHTLHDITYIRYPFNFSRKFRTVYKLLMPLMLMGARKIITVSRFSKNEICGYYKISPAKVEVVYNAANIKNAELSPNRTGDFFLSVSSPSENKNLLTLLKAYKLSKNSKKLVIAGSIDPKVFSELHGLDFYLSDPSIEFIGRVNDLQLNELYSNARAFLFPSLYEGFGIPPLEAQLFNCPILLSSIDTFKEVYSDSALYCDPFDLEKMAELINTIDSDEQLRSTLVNRGSINAKKYSWISSASRIIAIAKSILDEKN